MAQRKPIDLNRISPLTDFLRNYKAHIEAIKASGVPQVLTVNGKAELVVTSVEAYQLLLDELDRSQLVAGVLQSMREADKGEAMSLEDAEEKIRSELDL